MVTLLPIIGYESLDDSPPLKAHILSVIERMGLKPLPLNSATEPVIFNTDPAKTRITCSIILHDGVLGELERYWLDLILEHYPSSILIQSLPEYLPLRLTAHSAHLSLYGGIHESEIVQKTIDRIYDQIDNPELHIPSLLEYVRVTKYALHTAFTEWGHGGPDETIRSIRMHEAARLLLETRLRVYEVAFAVGYSALAGFDHAFHDHYGMTPGEFRHLGNPDVLRDKVFG